MPRNVLLQVRRGLEANIGTLADGELGYCTDTQKLYIGSAGGNVLMVASQTAGDMLKSVYDTNNNGKVDNADSADSVLWAGVSGKPSTYPPSAHQHSGADITSGTVASARLPVASTAAAGIVQLSSVTNSTSTIQAATPSAVKAAYDLANGKLSPSVTWGQLRGGV